jgi:hypothetical protein
MKKYEVEKDDLTFWFEENSGSKFGIWNGRSKEDYLNWMLSRTLYMKDVSLKMMFDVVK